MGKKSPNSLSQILKFLLDHYSGRTLNERSVKVLLEYRLSKNRVSIPGLGSVCPSVCVSPMSDMLTLLIIFFLNGAPSDMKDSLFCKVISTAELENSTPTTLRQLRHEEGKSTLTPDLLIGF